MKKIGEIKGVPVVEGDANLVKNQILYKETDKGISLSKRTNGKLEEVSGGSSNNSNFEYWYVKYVPNSDAEQEGIQLPIYFRRGVAKYDRNQGVVGLKKCTAWPTLHQIVYGMQAMEVVPIPSDVEIDGMAFTADTTSYDNFILSVVKVFIDNSLDTIPEEQLQAVIKDQFVEISKEEFEEIYNSAEN